MVAVLALVFSAHAGAETKVVDFDDVPAGTVVEDQYRESDGVFFRGPSQSDGWFPLVKAAPGQAHSGNQVASIANCTGGGNSCEFFTPVTIGRLTKTASSVSAFVGWIGSPSGPPPEPAKVELIARAAGGAEVGTSSAMVVEGAPFDQQLSVTSSNPDIASFELVAFPSLSEDVGFDDLALTYPDSPQPPDFSLSVSGGPTNVPQGDFAEVPVGLNRLNGSNGDISLSASGLPPGMSASFAPNPAPGAEGGTMMKLTAADNAPPSPNSYATIAITATPAAGAGSTPHSATTLVRVIENCVREYKIAYLDVRSNECMRSAGPDVLVATDQTVRVDGLALTPRTGTQRLVINKKKRTISSTITDAIEVALADHPAVPLYLGDIDWDLGTPGEGAKKIFEYEGKNVTLLAKLPVQKVAVSLTKAGKAQVNPTFKLGFWPFNYFGAVTAAAGFTADNDHGSDFTQLEIKVGKLEALGVELKDVSIKWKEGGSWAGTATLTLRFASSYSLTAGLGLKEGDLDFLKGAVGNLNVAVSPGVYLQSIGFGVERNPLALSGTVGFSAGPSVAGKTAVSVNGTFKAKLDDPLVFEVNGNAKLADKFSLGNVFLRYSSDGLFELGGKLDWDLEVAYVNGEVNGFVDGLRAASLEGTAHACIRIPWAPDPCAGGGFIVSNLGIAACVDVYIGSAGIGYEWGGDFDLWWGSCDLGPWRPARPSGARVSSAGASAANSFRLRAGLPSAAFEVRGAGAAPNVTLTGPHGERIAATSAAPYAKTKRLFAVQSGNETTYLVVKHPAAGTWTLSDDGAVPIERVRQAFGLPRPAVHAEVSGQGRKRTLRWRLRPIEGQQVKFVEEGRDVRNVIATTSARSGKAAFRPAEGAAGRRKIVALVEQNGLPRTSLTVGSYRAPGRVRPARPRQLRIVRRGSRLRVSWSAPRQGFRHAAYLRRSDGVRQLQIVAPGRKSATFARTRRGYGATVTVTGLTHANGRGPSATAKIAGVPPRRPAAGAWALDNSFGYTRRGGFTVAGRSGTVAGLSLTPGAVAAKACGRKELTVLGARGPSRVTRAGLARWAVGQRSPRTATGVKGVRVTVLRGRKRLHGRLELIFSGPRAGEGEVELKGCRLHFLARRR
ncbi:MAG TPA: hypothetical protein VG898_05830 [Solirubrobacterales bacterium]|nr:hypothetical protein [Solirubrobacterales bacterium]